MRITTLVHNFLDDFCWLVQHLEDRPMHIYELVPTEPSIVGATNAAGEGMGSVYFVPLPHSTDASPMYEAVLWRLTFPTKITTCLLMQQNPHGSITNSDLELTATVVHHDVIAAQCGVAEATIATLHDNVAAVMWNRKGSATTEGPTAYLLGLQALPTRHC